MRMLVLLIVVFLSTVLPVYGQPPYLILTREQNVMWVDSLQKLNLDQQLSAIRGRMLADTNVFVRQFYNDRIRLDELDEQVSKHVYGSGKPIVVIGSKLMMSFDNKTASNTIVSLTNLLTPEFIKEITILGPNDPAATALYGPDGRSGILFMSVTKKKYLRMFKKLAL